MARSVSRLFLAGILAASTVAPAFADSGLYNTPSPMATFTNPLQSLTNGSLLTNLATANGINSMLSGQGNLGSILQASALQSQLLGGNLINMDTLKTIAIGMVMQKVMGSSSNPLMTSIATGAVSSMLGGSGASGITGLLGGTGSNLNSMSGLLGTGLGSTLSSSGSFGGLVNSVVSGAINGAVTNLETQALQQALGGISGSGSSSGGSNISYSNGATTTSNNIGGTTTTVNSDGSETVKLSDGTTLSLSSIAPKNTNSMNYSLGNSDGAGCGQPDPRFMLTSGTYDTNYWWGYSTALKGCS